MWATTLSQVYLYVNNLFIYVKTVSNKLFFVFIDPDNLILRLNLPGNILDAISHKELCRYTNNVSKFVYRNLQAHLGHTTSTCWQTLNALLHLMTFFFAPEHQQKSN